MKNSDCPCYYLVDRNKRLLEIEFTAKTNLVRTKQRFFFFLLLTIHSRPACFSRAVSKNIRRLFISYYCARKQISRSPQIVGISALDSQHRDTEREGIRQHRFPPMQRHQLGDRLQIRIQQIDQTGLG